jgi:hypothetical protein
MTIHHTPSLRFEKKYGSYTLVTVVDLRFLLLMSPPMDLPPFYSIAARI